MKYLTIKVLLEYDEIVFRDILIQDHPVVKLPIHPITSL